MKVIGIGDNVVDNYLHLRTLFPGGNALNFAVYASMLGCEAAYLGVFGTDEAARHVQKTLSNMGIDTSRCRSAAGPNGQALLRIEDGERIFISSNEGGVSKTVPMEFIFEDSEYLQSFSIIHTSAYSYMDDCLPKLQKLESVLSYDFSDDFDREHALSLCRHIDVGFFSCSGWSDKRTMELLEEAVNKGCPMAVATRGSQDVILFNGQAWFKQAPKEIIPTDTMGAGDAFISSFLIACFGDRGNKPTRQGLLIENALRKATEFAAGICQLQGSFGHGLRY